MALMDNLKKDKQSVMFVAIGPNSQTVYIKTNKYNNPKDLIDVISRYGVLLKRVGENPVEIAYAPGFFFSAQVIGEQTVSAVHNKIWEIV